MIKENVGKISVDLNKNRADNTHSALEQMREQLSEWDYNLFKCIEESKSIFSGDFYVVVITKKERLMDNVLRNYFRGRLSCPTPEWDQTVYFYDRKADHIEFLWVVPSKHACQVIKDNILELPEEQRQLSEFVLAFHDGTLLNVAKKRNKEIE